MRLKPTFFFWKNQFQLIFHEILSKSNRFMTNRFMKKSLKKNLEAKKKFVEIFFLNPSEIGILGLTWRVTL